MSWRKLIITTAVCAVAFAAAPSTASADWLITPFVGWNFHGSADVSGNGGQSFSNQFAHKVDYGVSASQMGKGVVGWEVDFGYSPNFFANTKVNGFQFTNTSNATTLTGNVIVGIPVGSSYAAQIRPYAVGGVGLIRTNVQDAAGFFNVTTKNDFGFDLGAGAMAFFNQNVGIRGDVRYFRGFRGTNSNDVGLGLSNFNFWRGSVGVTFKF